MNKKKLLEAKSILKYYDKIFVCRKCRMLYGSDLKEEDGFCPLCSKKRKDV